MHELAVTKGLLKICPVSYTHLAVFIIFLVIVLIVIVMYGNEILRGSFKVQVVKFLPCLLYTSVLQYA